MGYAAIETLHIDRRGICGEVHLHNANDDGTYTITLSPSGDGKNGIPTGKDFYDILRSYVPSPGATMKVRVEKQ